MLDIKSTSKNAIMVINWYLEQILNTKKRLVYVIDFNVQEILKCQKVHGIAILVKL